MSADTLPTAIRGSEATFEAGSRAIDAKEVERSVLNSSRLLKAWNLRMVMVSGNVWANAVVFMFWRITK